MSAVCLVGFDNGLANSEDNNADVKSSVADHLNRFTELIDSRSTTFRSQLIAFIPSAFDIDRFAPQVLQKSWEGLTAHEQSSFKTALTKSMANNLLEFLSARNINKSPVLQLRSQTLKERFAKLTYSFSAGSGTQSFTLYVLKNLKGEWRVSDIKRNDESLRQFYYTICKDLLDHYSFEYLVGELIGEGYVVLEDFESSEVGKLPHNWTWKSKDDDRNKPYEIQNDSNNQFLAANDKGESVIIGKDVKWDLKEYPYISFRVRTRAIPRGGDERYGKTVDSAAGIYLVYKKKFGLIPEAVKFVWSSTLPVGSIMRRSGTGRPWMLVFDSGETNMHKWRTYVFDAYEIYKQAFKGDPPDRAIGIGILSDANSTDSDAFADYDDIKVLKQANADAGITQFLEAE